jgi:acetoacetate decarboxylase
MDEKLKFTTAGETLGNLGRVLRGKANLWENARFVLAQVPLDRGELKKILPCGLWPADPAVGTLFIVNYTKTSFTAPYKESGLLINVRTLLGSGVHCCWMVVDDDTALIYGRELLGYPKKMAEIAFEEKDNHVSASVSRRGIKLLSMDAEKGPAQSPAPPIFDRKTFNASGMGQLFLLNPVWMFRPREVIKESYSAAVSINLAESEYDPISKLISGPAISGRIAVSDIPGSYYQVPVGIAGPKFFANTFFMRFR